MAKTKRSKRKASRTSPFAKTASNILKFSGAAVGGATGVKSGGVLGRAIRKRQTARSRKKR
jgi:hypothetical protein